MRNPAKVLAGQFVRRSPTELLAVGTALAIADLLTVYAASVRDGVIRIPGGVGLANHYGLFSTIAGNAIALYAARKYYDGVCSIRESKAMLDKTVVEDPLTDLQAMVELRGEYRYILWLLLVIGTLSFFSNFAVHIFGDPLTSWGLVFDSADHRWSFVAGRLHNVYTWIVIMPFVVYVMICSSIQLRRAMTVASQAGVLKYDLLNPDRRGGFGFLERSVLAFNIVGAMVYVEITLHAETFGRLNLQHIVNYIIATVLLLVVNKIVFADMYATVRKLRLESLNKVKDQVFQNNELSFEILKYCYERRINTVEVANVLVQASALAIPGIVKFWPQLARLFIPA